MENGTFSILARSRDSELIGVAVATGSESVDERVPHAKPGVGVVATQAYTNIAYGINGLELLAEGRHPQEVLNRLLMEDSDCELRQVAIMDFKGRRSVFTGAKTPEFHGEFLGRDYVVIGNLLVGIEVIKSMAEAFEGSRGDLARRMVIALKAGKESGGDRRGEKSAALIVVGRGEVEAKAMVDVHKTPIEALYRKLR